MTAWESYLRTDQPTTDDDPPEAKALPNGLLLSILDTDLDHGRTALCGVCLGRLEGQSSVKFSSYGVAVLARLRLMLPDPVYRKMIFVAEPNDAAAQVEDAYQDALDKELIVFFAIDDPTKAAILTAMNVIGLRPGLGRDVH